MSMILSHPVPDANAHAKAMIDAVIGHQPSPMDSEYSRKMPARTKETSGEESFEKGVVKDVKNPSS